jgi:hypothetical protein
VFSKAPPYKGEGEGVRGKKLHTFLKKLYAFLTSALD